MPQQPDARVSVSRNLVRKLLKRAAVDRAIILRAWPVRRVTSLMVAPIRPDGSVATDLARADAAAARLAIYRELRRESQYSEPPVAPAPAARPHPSEVSP